MIELLYLTSLIILPIAGLVISNHISTERYYKNVKWVILFFVLHNVLFLFDYSLKGDNADYIVFAVEYPFVLLAVILYADVVKNIFTRVLKIAGLIAMIIGILWGAINLILFIGVEMELVSDKKFNYTSNNKSYETRRYNFSFATLMNARFTFETYRTYDYLLFEKLIDKSVFFDNKTDLNIWGDLNFQIKESAKQDSLIISSGGVSVRKPVR